jgi:hypothetical protein
VRLVPVTCRIVGGTVSVVVVALPSVSAVPLVGRIVGGVNRVVELVLPSVIVFDPFPIAAAPITISLVELLVFVTALPIRMLSVVKALPDVSGPIEMLPVPVDVEAPAR